MVANKKVYKVIKPGMTRGSSYYYAFNRVKKLADFINAIAEIKQLGSFYEVSEIIIQVLSVIRDCLNYVQGNNSSLYGEGLVIRKLRKKIEKWKENYQD